MPIYDLAGRTVAITGSTGGLGTALAAALRQRGANLALLDLSKDAVEKQAEHLGGETVARGWAADVRDLDSLKAAMAQAADHFTRLDVVIANAGVDTMATRLELRHLGVGVGSVHPTFFKTPMMNEVIADPAGNTLWGGNEKGLWKMTPREQVVKDVVRGIECRADMIISPKTNTMVAKMPGIFRTLIERAGFHGTTIPDAIAKASGTGWNQNV